ncbi:nucleotidyl transferase AbiEii/AbiGii toxin family protein [Anatilimnocola floriformis]|uniref:nucleotidyl transferase AbiEii/AbiGii toxin family protein n=1 Tax=Anatilimnocola floriformis TaxID=2948575 RepID=UPI0020C33FC4|nr:nucleotidyl transferase AbiEii/AbiGii toxin family protein [Anatilimnocola floriformis]
MAEPYSKYPHGYQLLWDDERVKRPDVFEPALQHHPCGFRKGEPQFRDPAMRTGWYAARRAATDHWLQLVANSSVGSNLVLRGSSLLRTYLGDSAREPGDMDWVVQPESIAPDDSRGRELLASIRQLIEETNSIPGTQITWGRFAEDDIWIYSRAPGKRLTINWLAPDLPAGNVQLDFVFGEALWTPPVTTQVRLHNQQTVQLYAASPAQSLAWKLMWLEEDAYAQGKDLYDAVLLAEAYALPDDMRERLQIMIQPYGRRTIADWPLTWEVDWQNFQLEYPQILGNAQQWQERLASALAQRPNHLG